VKLSPAMTLAKESVYRRNKRLNQRILSNKEVELEEGEIPKAIGHIVQFSVEASACSSCGTCEVVCATVHEGATSPSLRRIWLDRFPFEARYITLTCQQCDSPECYFACPLKDEALCIDIKTGARYINGDNCTGCRSCIEACPFDPPRINFDTDRNIATKCDLCKDRPNGPACVEFCTTKCLILAEKEQEL